MLSWLVFLLSDSLTVAPVSLLQSVVRTSSHHVSKKHQAEFCDLTFSPVMCIDLLQAQK